MSVYSNLTHKRRTKKDLASRKKAEYLASLPKDPVRRFVYRMHPRNFFGYWFSKKGGIMALKITGVAILLVFLMVGALFAYFRKDLDSISPGQLANRVQTTVTRYYDRNNQLLWEDKGSENYRLVVKGDEISKYMKQATIAIEDKDFYKHGAISVTGIFRSVVNNTQGGAAQGGSTLTQQLVKQVFLSSQANNRGLSGLPRKIKEMILAVEVERMYSKDDILNLYLNESPYGGRRNGVESAAQTYFGVKAKELNLAQSALLAAIPNQPGLYDPYNTAGNQALVARQHRTLDNMVSQGYITQQESDEAKKVPILDSLKPQSDQYTDMKAPHFVQMVRTQLEEQLGKTTVGQGGLNVMTTLDLTIQNDLQQNISDMFAGTLTDRNCSYANCANYAGFTNGAGAIEDTQTGQLLAMVGSRDFNYGSFGQDNAAAAMIQPGSSIKPLVYAQLFQDQGSGNQNYYSGTVLSDVKTNFNGWTPQNADGGFKGNIPVRSSLALSQNIPAIKAMAINEKNSPGSTWKTIRELGNTSYCMQGADAQAGLSSAIGSCGTRLIDHTNAMASLARMGAYIPQSTILKVTNSQGQILKQFKQETPKQAVDPQAAYIVNDILGDSRARAGLGWNQDYLFKLGAMGVKTAVKTGTSNAEINKKILPKDLWTVGYTPHLSMAVWLGNPDTTPLRQGNSLIPAMIFDKTMSQATQHYIAQNKAKTSDWFQAPSGIQKIGNEIAPSYYNKSQANTSTMMTFDKVSKKLATECTPQSAQIQQAVSKITDPYTKSTSMTAADGYDPNAKDDIHNCSDSKPSVSSISVSPVGGSGASKITVAVNSGTHSLQTLEISVNGQAVQSVPVSASGTYSINYTFTDNGTKAISAVVSDRALYSGNGSVNYTPNTPGSRGNNN